MILGSGTHSSSRSRSCRSRCPSTRASRVLTTWSAPAASNSPGSPHSEAAFLNGVGLSTPCFQRFLGRGGWLEACVDRGVGSTRSARSHEVARTNGVEAARRQCDDRRRPRRASSRVKGGMELRSASVSMSRSTAARGCQALVRDDVAA